MSRKKDGKGERGGGGGEGGRRGIVAQKCFIKLSKALYKIIKRAFFSYYYHYYFEKRKG